MAETTALQAKMKLDTTEVKRTGTLEKGYKVTGISGSGTLKLNKVTSYFIKKISENLKKRKSNKSNDHHKPGRSRSIWSRKNSLDNCVFTELTLADWEAGKLLEESIPFNFSSFEVLNTIDA
mgnify:CR=1 FL=1